MKTILTTLLGVSILTLVGCAADAEPETGATDDVIAKVTAQHQLSTQQANTSGGTTSSCTTTRECDKDYCCTTETCKYSTYILCVPNKAGTVISR